MKSSKPLKVSVCMHAMNRTWQVKQTLRHNVMACVNHELILVDFGSTDGLDEWVRSEFTEDIRAKRLVYFRTPTPTRFHASKSKNLAHHLGSGDILLNCDGDNFVTEADLDRIVKVFAKEPNSIVQNFSGDLTDGTYGRIALTRKNFNQMGGYDEGLLPIAAQDYDLLLRGLQIGLRTVRISAVDKKPVLNTVSDKVPAGSKMDWGAINNINSSYCINRQKVIGPVRETQSPAWHGFLNLDAKKVIVEQPAARAAKVSDFANYPAKYPSDFMGVFNRLRAHMGANHSTPPKDLLNTLHRAWGNTCNLSVGNLAQISEAALRSGNPVLFCGSGLGALALAATGAKRIIALEPNRIWLRDMEFLRRFLGLQTLQIVLAPVKTDPGKSWYDFRLPSNFKEKISTVVYDRASGANDDTVSGLAAGLGPLLSPDFKIFIDNAERDSEKQAISQWAHVLGDLNVKIFKGDGAKRVALVSKSPPSQSRPA
ncbi:glycosyltransferase family A protein [Ramlibacter sp.]|uniref:glycosyltransferase family A protein n=1 Tax=Ramlibacter sp. TaxID=1917967 RepID=UPI00262F7242|nr:glycosyltransferase family A protein [Ramlibacter sp.]